MSTANALDSNSKSVAVLEPKWLQLKTNQLLHAQVDGATTLVDVLSAMQSHAIPRAPTDWVETELVMVVLNGTGHE